MLSGMQLSKHPVVVQGELSAGEASKIDFDGKKQESRCGGMQENGLPHASGTFPIHKTSTETYSKDMFKAYRQFKKHAAQDIIKKDAAQTDLGFKQIEITDDKEKRIHGIITTPSWIVFDKDIKLESH